MVWKVFTPGISAEAKNKSSAEAQQPGSRKAAAAATDRGTAGGHKRIESYFEDAEIDVTIK